MTPTQRRALESLERGPRFPSPRFHKTFRALVRLGYATHTFRTGVDIDDRARLGFEITSEGRKALRYVTICTPCGSKLVRRPSRDVDATPPSSRRVPRSASAYRFAVGMALVREHRMTDARAGLVVQRWERLVESSRQDGRSPSSTAEQIARFERQKLAPLPARRDRARKRRRS